MKKITYVFSLFIFLLLINSTNVKATTITDVVSDIALLEDYAENFIKQSNNTNVSSKELVFGYMCKNGIDSYWNNVLIKNNAMFEEYVMINGEKNLSYLQSLDDISNNSTRVNFKLLINSLNALENNNSAYYSWGYLISKECINFNESGNIEDLMKNIFFISNSSKINAVIDAININKEYKNNNLSESLSKYYNSISTQTRIKNFTLNAFGVDLIKRNEFRENVYLKFVDDNVCVKTLNDNGLKIVNNNKLTAACNVFADYIYNNHPNIVKETIIDDENNNENIDDEDINNSEENNDNENVEIPTIEEITSMEVINFPDEFYIGQVIDLDIEVLPISRKDEQIDVVCEGNCAEVNGKVLTIKEAGDFVLTLKDSKGKIFKEYNITIEGKVSMITPIVKDYELNIGDEVKLAYEMDVPSDDKVVWETISDVISLSEDGTIKALKMGEARVVCSLENDKTIFTTFTIKVLSPIQSLTIVDKTNIKEMSIGDTYSLRVTIIPAIEKNTLIYESSNPNVCIVEDGVIKAIAPGECRIIVKSSKDESKKDSISIKVLSVIKNVNIPKSYIDIDLRLGKEGKINVFFYPDDFDENSIKIQTYKLKDGKEVYNTAISYDFETGIVTAKEIGDYRVYICDKDYNKLGDFTVDVIRSVEKMEEDEDSFINSIDDNLDLNKLDQAIEKFLFIIKILIITVAAITGMLIICACFLKSGKKDDDENEFYEDGIGYINNRKKIYKEINEDKNDFKVNPLDVEKEMKKQEEKLKKEVEKSLIEDEILEETKKTRVKDVNEILNNKKE